MIRGVAGLSTASGQERSISSFSSFFYYFLPLFLIVFVIFFLTLVLPVGGLPIRQGPGYANGQDFLHDFGCYKISWCAVILMVIIFKKVQSKSVSVTLWHRNKVTNNNKQMCQEKPHLYKTSWCFDILKYVNNQAIKAVSSADYFAHQWNISVIG